MPDLRAPRISSILRPRACWRYRATRPARPGVPWSTTGSQYFHCPAPASRASRASCSAARRAHWCQSGGVTFGSLLRHRTRLTFGAGVVDRDVKTTEASHGLVDQVADVVFVAHVGADEFSFRAEATELPGQGMARLVATAGDNNPGAFFRKGQGRGSADTGQGACNQDDGCTHGRSPLKADCVAGRICGKHRVPRPGRAAIAVIASVAGDEVALVHDENARCV